MEEEAKERTPSEKYADKKLMIVDPEFAKSSYLRHNKMRVHYFDGYDLEQAFDDGIEWKLSSIWRSPEEEPKRGEWIVLDRGEEPPLSGELQGIGWRDSGTYFGIYDGHVYKEITPSKWCYFKDICQKEMIDKLNLNIY